MPQKPFVGWTPRGSVGGAHSAPKLKPLSWIGEDPREVYRSMGKHHHHLSSFSGRRQKRGDICEKVEGGNGRERRTQKTEKRS